MSSSVTQSSSFGGRARTGPGCFEGSPEVAGKNGCSLNRQSTLNGAETGSFRFIRFALVVLMLCRAPRAWARRSARSSNDNATKPCPAARLDHQDSTLIKPASAMLFAGHPPRELQSALVFHTLLRKVAPNLPHPRMARRAQSPRDSSSRRWEHPKVLTRGTFPANRTA
jgi:hypothetical protein